jgi:hypothetical protein
LVENIELAVPRSESARLPPTAGPGRTVRHCGGVNSIPQLLGFGAQRYHVAMRWSGRTMRTGALLTALLVAGGVGLAPLSDVDASATTPGVHRNTVACQYVYQTYSGLFLRPLEGFRPSEFSQKVAGAASPTLRKELAYWEAAKAYKNWGGTVEAGTAMVNTCDHLGLSSLD